MSDLLNKASLVMIPSGYKEDVVYSAVPTDGSGDLSFIRASNGTRINSAGLVEDCPWNMVSYSEQFDSPFWNKGTSGSATFVVTANATTAPNGTNTADLISITRSATSELAATYTFVGQGVGTFKNTIWLKAKDSSNVGKTIDLWSWEGDTRGYTKVTLTADWVRYEQNTTVFTGTASELFDFGLLPISYSTSTTLAVEFYAWGAQSNIGSTAKPYFPTTDRLNVPRLTYQNGGGGCPSLLLEKQSTNHILYSEDYSQTAWTKTGTAITTNSIISPDGTQNADLITTNDASGSVYRIYEANLAGSNAVCTTSVYFKYGNWQYVFITCDNYSNSPRYAVFDLINNTNTFVSSGYTATITSVGNGWYRCTLTGEMKSDTYAQFGLAPNNSTYGGTSLPDGKTLYIWGTQREQSSYPTSYIPTTSSSATRVSDACFKTGISSLIGQTEGTIFADINPEEFQTGSYLGITDGTITNRIIFGFESGSVNSGTLLVFGLSGLSSGGTYTRGQRIKVALAYKSGDSVLYVNGSQVQTATTTFSGSFSQFRFDSFAGTQNFIGKVNESLLSKTRLTNAELASLTTI